MVVVLLVVVYSMVVLLNYCLAPFTEDWPMLARLFATIFCQVILMTYVVMPHVTRLFRPWLFGEQK
jgi:antibiotic biosynthesis monooxygenase (ABM) superfamily enzyme